MVSWFNELTSEYYISWQPHTSGIIMLYSLIILTRSSIIGSKPFGDFAVGASLEPFIQHLKDGNRLPQSEGLRDSV